MAKRRVVIIGTRGYPSYYGGFETAVRKLAPHLADAGWDVAVYGRHGSTKDDDPGRDERVLSIRTVGLESKSISTLSYGFTAAVNAALRKPDVALVMNVANGFFLPLLKLRGIRTVVNVDGIEWDRAKWGRVAKAAFRMGAWFTAKFADALVFDAHEIGRRWREDFRRDGSYIPYGGERVESLPIQPGLSHRGYVLVVARFVPENTIPEFIEAARILAERHQVVFVGSSGYGGAIEEQVRDLAEESENVRWYGHVSNDDVLLSLWQHAGAYFHGHSVGGTNPTLVQAMAAGTPVVARDTPYNREVLGSTGRFVAPVAQHIAEGVQEVMEDPILQDQLSKSASDRSLELFTWSAVCTAYDSLLRNVMEGGSTSAEAVRAS